MSTQHISDTTMRQAVARRDRNYDGRFVYAVITTGVYCRPSCPSRAALPENLRFFATPGAAEAAGFRPCKRCKPLAGADTDRMVELARYIQQHAAEKLSLADLAAHMKLSPTHLQKAFKAAFGVSPKAYQDAARTNRLKELLQAGDAVAGAIYEAGFGSPSRVYGQAMRSAGMTPAAYRAGGAGESIDYAYRQTSLGGLMMAATGKGVCFAMFGDSEAALLRQLKAEFPNAELAVSANSAAQPLDEWMAALEHHLAEQAPRPDLPLDLRGTAFQIKVWRFLLSVKDGDVVSYGEVAAAIDQPRAVRAAASACGANRIAVLVPCHRVLRSNGELGGYRWGADRKRTLLDLERRQRGAIVGVE